MVHGVAWLAAGALTTSLVSTIATGGSTAGLILSSAAGLLVLNGLVWWLVLTRRIWRRPSIPTSRTRPQRDRQRSDNIELRRMVAEQTSELRRMAESDRLTGLPNREVFKGCVETAIQGTRLTPPRNFAVLFLDIDHFKVINDSLGHGAGDRLLLEVAHRLKAVADAVNAEGQCVAMAARQSGDEFVMLVSGFQGDGPAMATASRVLAVMREPCEVEGKPAGISVSVGVRVSVGVDSGAEEVLRDADTAMYAAKASGRNRYAVFDPTMHETVRHRLTLQNDLSQAIERNQLRLVYQPIIELESGELWGFEAMARWKHPTLGEVPPAEFVPVMEDTGQITPIGHWIAAQACRQLASWDAMGLGGPRGLHVSINISRRQLDQVEVIERLTEEVKATGANLGRVHFEIADSTVMVDPRRADLSLRLLKKMGSKVAMADFGTDRASLRSLHRLPIDVLKIDRSFVRDMAQRPEYAAVVHAIVVLAHNLGVRVVAEGVETHEQLAQLQALECDAAQGYLFAGPLELGDVEGFVGKWGRVLQMTGV